MRWLDLHMHSNYSDDGEFSPKELMTLCNQAGIRIAALSDHNSTAGVQQAMQWAAHNNILLIPAIELDCTYKGVNLHLLGYWINPDDPAYTAVEADIIRQEQAVSLKRIELVRALGIHVDQDRAMHLSRYEVVTGEIIAEVALQDEANANSPLLTAYRPGESRSDNPYVNFYWDYCSQGKPAYVPIQYMDFAEAVALIKRTGGIAVLAHPGINVKEDAQLLHELILHGIAGLEVYSSYHNAEQTEFYRSKAEQYQLAASFGSDFHGKTKPSVKMGQVECDRTEADIISALLNKWSEAYVKQS